MSGRCRVVRNKDGFISMPSMRDHKALITFLDWKGHGPSRCKSRQVRNWIFGAARACDRRRAHGCVGAGHCSCGAAPTTCKGHGALHPRKFRGRSLQSELDVPGRGRAADVVGNERAIQVDADGNLSIDELEHKAGADILQMLPSWKNAM